MFALQITLPYPAASNERPLPGGNSRWRCTSEVAESRAGAVKFDGIRAFNCSILHTCHTGSSLATGTKKNTVKKSSISSSAPPAVQAGFVAFNTRAMLATKVLSTLL